MLTAVSLNFQYLLFIKLTEHHYARHSNVRTNFRREIHVYNKTVRMACR
jgi:hypothetical protein